MSCALAIGSATNFSALVEPGSTYAPVIRTHITANLFDVFAEVAISTSFISSADHVINTTYILPLLEHSIVHDVEILVDGEKRVVVDSNSMDEVKFMLERRAVAPGKQVFYVQVGEVPPGKEVSVKCTYATVLAIEGGAIQFVLPASVTPSVGNPLSASLSLEAHDSITAVTSSLPSSSITTSIADNKASVDFSVGPDVLISDLVVAFQVNDIAAPRVWTSVGTSGESLITRASVLVLQPPLRQLMEESNNEVYFDVLRRNPSEDFQACLSDAFETDIPQHIFEQPLAATAEHFQQAIERLRYLKPILDDESSALQCMDKLLSTQISQPPRVLLLVTDANGTQIDSILKLVSGHSATTRSVILYLERDGPSSKYVNLVQANGGDVICVAENTLRSRLSEAVARNIQPSQSLTISWSPHHTHQVPSVPPPLFYNTMYLLYAISSASSDIKKGTMVNVRLSDTECSAKSISTSLIHRMGCAALLNEAALNGVKKLDQIEQHHLAKILYSSWIDYKEFRPPLTGTVSEPSLSYSKRDSGNNLNLIASMRSISGPLSRTTNGSDKVLAAAANFKLASSKRIAPQSQESTGGSGQSMSDSNMVQKAPMSIRDFRMGSYKGIRAQTDVNAADHEERMQVSVTGAEAVLLEYVASLVNEGKALGTQLSRSHAQAARAFVASIMTEQYLAKCCTKQSEPDLDVNKMKQLSKAAFIEKWEFNDLSVDHKSTYRAYVAAERGCRTHMEDKHAILDAASDLFGREGPSWSFFGVYDGHSGRAAADFCKTNLAYNIFRDPSFDITDPSAAITAGYEKTDKDFLVIAQKEQIKAGSTAVTLLLCGDKIVVSNVGDSEAVLCKNGEAVCLSTVHNPANESEKQRVESTGGKIINYGGTFRVGGILAVTRSFGDIALKEQVIATPSTLSAKIESGDEFIVLASDGLYENMKHQDVVDFIRTERAKEPPVGMSTEEFVTKQLVEEALRKGSRDNVTALVVFFAK